MSTEERQALVNAVDKIMKLEADVKELVEALDRLIREGSWSRNDPQTRHARAVYAKYKERQ